MTGGCTILIGAVVADGCRQNGLLVGSAETVVDAARYATGPVGTGIVGVVISTDMTLGAIAAVFRCRVSGNIRVIDMGTGQRRVAVTIITGRPGAGREGRGLVMTMTVRTNLSGIMTIRGNGPVVMTDAAACAVRCVVTGLTDTGVAAVKVAGGAGFVGEAAADDQHRRRVRPHPLAVNFMTKSAGVATVAGTARSGAVVVVAVVRGVTGFTVAVIVNGAARQHIVVGRTVKVSCCHDMTSVTGSCGVSGIEGSDAAVTGGGKVGFYRSGPSVDGGNDTDMAGCASDRGGIGPDRLTIVAGGNTVGRTVAGVTYGILIVGYQAGGIISMTGASAGTIIGMADGTS